MPGKEHRSSSQQLLVLILLFSWLILTSIQASLAQSQQTLDGRNSAQNNLVEFDRIGKLQQDMEKLTNKVDAELGAANRAFNVLYVFGAIGSFLAGLFVVLSWLRDNKRYERERKFLEDRAQNTEQWQRETHILEGEFADQQLKLGDKFLNQSDSMLSRQIESITKLGGVIDLVKKSFELQSQREEAQQKAHEQLEKLNQILAGFTDHFQCQYDQSRDLIFTFQRHSRMTWTRLSVQEESLTSRARTSFETIPEFILNQQREKAPHELARVYQLLGVSAFYANDIDAAIRYLEKAHTIYSAVSRRSEDLFSSAFCSHFLGVIEKNWCHIDRSPEANLAEAKRHLEEANSRLADIQDELLTPLTLAEVLSYSERNRGAARELLDEKIKIFKRMESSPGLNANQHALLERAYLLRGNLDFLGGQIGQALEWYTQSKNLNEKNPYALLSIAHAHAVAPNKPSEKLQFYQDGLAALESSGAINKKEITVRVTALAWAVIASHEINEHEKVERYLKELDAIGSNIRLVGKREALFFCPTGKNLVTFERLRKNLIQYEKSE